VHLETIANPHVGAIRGSSTRTGIPGFLRLARASDDFLEAQHIADRDSDRWGCRGIPQEPSRGVCDGAPGASEQFCPVLNSVRREIR